jgi:hypothetical protein
LNCSILDQEPQRSEKQQNDSSNDKHYFQKPMHSLKTPNREKALEFSRYKRQKYGKSADLENTAFILCSETPYHRETLHPCHRIFV